MKFVVPHEIAPAHIAESNIPVNDYAEYDPEVTYANLAWVRITTGGLNRIYQSVNDGNIGNNPLLEDMDPEVVPKHWAYAGSTNNWALFDPRSGASQAENGIDITLQNLGRVQAIALLGITATDIEITVLDSEGNAIYHHAQDLLDSTMVGGYWDWFYLPRRQMNDIVLDDLPIYLTATIRIVIKNAGSMASIRNLVLGRVQEIGGTRYGAEVSILSYGIKKRDVFGNLYLKKRATSRRNALDVWVDAIFVDELTKLLEEYDAVPLVWIGAPGYQSLIIYGIYIKARTVISLPRYSVLTIDIEGFV